MFSREVGSRANVPLLYATETAPLSNMTKRKQQANADAMSRRPNSETHNKAVQCFISTITSTDRHDIIATGISEITHTLSIDLEKIQ